METEVARYRQKCETLEKQLETSNKDLADERQKAQVTTGLFSTGNGECFIRRL